MPLGEWAVSSLLIPFLAAFAAAALPRVPVVARRPWVAASLSAGALAIGYAVGHARITHPAFPPHDVTDRIVWIALAAALVAAPAARWAGPRWLASLLLGALVAWALFEPVQERWRKQDGGAMALVLASLALLAGLGNAVRIGQRPRPAWVGAGCVLLAGATAVAQAATGSLTLARLTLALAAAALAALLVDRSAFRAPVVLVFGSVLGALLLDGWVYSAMPAWAALGLGWLPLAAWPFARLARGGPMP